MVAPAESGGDNKFEERLSYWQRALLEGGQEVVTRYANTIINELDSLCPLLGQECLFIGHSIWPRMDEEGEVQEIEIGQLASEAKGIHNGTQIRILEGNKPRIWYEFLVHNCLKEPNAVERSPHSVYAYLDPSDCIITPVSDFDAPFQADPLVEIADEQEVHTILSKASDELAATLHSSAFRKLPRIRQQEFINDYLHRYETETAINSKAVAIHAAHFYRIVKAGDDGQASLSRHEFADGEYIDAPCLSLGTLADQRLAEQPIKNVRDLVDKMAGLCLVLALDDYHPALGLCRGDIVYVPLSSQEVEAYVHPRNDSND